MIIEVGRTGTADEFTTLLDKVVSQANINSMFILACDNNNFSPSTIDPCLKSCKTPLFGGIFPELVIGKERLRKGCIIVGFRQEAAIYNVPNLSDMEADFEELIEQQDPIIGSAKTMLVLVDGLAKRICSVVESIFNIFGLELNYIGGGAGSLSFSQKPCLFSNEGLLKDSALLVLLNIKSGIGVSHGWYEVCGPYKVTEADRNTIKTLDWQPAFQVYQQNIHKHSEYSINTFNFFDIAKRFPFGINKLETEKIVRDPLLVKEDNSLTCVGEVSAESYLHILTGDVDSLVNAAKNAYHLGASDYNGDPDNKLVLFIDCMSRAFFLKDDFYRELDVVNESGAPLIGALTIGEIANCGKDYLEFYNKTSVVGILENK